MPKPIAAEFSPETYNQHRWLLIFQFETPKSNDTFSQWRPVPEEEKLKSLSKLIPALQKELKPGYSIAGPLFDTQGSPPALKILFQAAELSAAHRQEILTIINSILTPKVPQQPTSRP